MKRSLALLKARFECGEKSPKDVMLRTRTKRNDNTIKGSGGSAFKGGIKGKHHSQRKKQILINLFLGFAIVFLVGLFFSLFVYDIDDLENASSFRDGKGKLDDAHDESGRKRRNREEEKEKEKNRSSVKDVEKEEEYSRRSHGRNGSRFGSAVTPNARFDTRSSFAQSFALSKGNGRSFPYRYVFVPFLFARLLRHFQRLMSSFSSYKNRFKVFVYEDVPEALNADLRTKRSDKCKDNGYANAEWKIPELIAKSEVYTPDPELADFYVVPLFPECYVRDKLEKGGADYVTAVRKVNKMYQAAIDRIAGNYPYWRRSEGRDHVFIFPAEKGAENVLNEKTLERIGKAIKIVGVPTFKSSLSSSGGEDSDGDGSNRGDSNSESQEEEEKEEEENNSAKAMATRRARYAFSPFRDIIVPPVRDSRDEAYALVKAEMENVFSARRKIRMHFRGKVVSEDDEFFGAGGSGSSSESGGSDTKTDSSTGGRKSSSSSSFNVRRRAYEQLKGLKGVNVVIDESNTASSFEVTGGIETDKGRKNATFSSSSSSSSSCDRKCVLREMRKSETCLITPHGGLEGWSTALSDAILSGCVPLIVHDDFEPYFSDVLDWENFSYKIPTREALRNAKDALLHEKSKASSITRSKRENDLKIAARASVWNDKWQSGDALDALFESLRRRVRYHRNSPFRFYAEADRNG